jgi:sulfur carrier protein
VEEDDEGEGQGQGGLTVIVNGEARVVAAGSTVVALLESMELGAKWVVVERNGEPVEKRDMASTVLGDGDRLEIVRAVAGG